MDFAKHGPQTSYFSLKGKNMQARVVDIYDGDTIKMVVYIFGEYFKFDARLSSIDTCEIRSKDAANKDLAIKARNRLFTLVTGTKCEASWKKRQMSLYLEEHSSVIYVKCGDFDKYGRVIVECYSDEHATESFSDILKRERLAYAYDGGAKLSEKRQLSILKMD